MKTAMTIGILIALSITAAGCAMRDAESSVTGPSVAVMPAPNKPFEVFAAEQTTCKNYARGEIAGLNSRGNRSGVGGVLASSGLGAGLGAAVGGGDGAVIGAASGAIAGAGVVSVNSRRARAKAQSQYDIAFAQCMYAKGNQVPEFGYLPPPPPPPPVNSP